MKLYKNKSGNSGVIAYETGKTFIRVKFIEGEEYTYSYKSAGKSHIEKMKTLAESGEGLSGYISQHVKDHYDKNK